MNGEMTVWKVVFMLITVIPASKFLLTVFMKMISPHSVEDQSVRGLMGIGAITAMVGMASRGLSRGHGAGSASVSGGGGYAGATGGGSSDGGYSGGKVSGGSGYTGGTNAGAGSYTDGTGGGSSGYSDGTGSGGYASATNTGGGNYTDVTGNGGGGYIGATGSGSGSYAGNYSGSANSGAYGSNYNGGYGGSGSTGGGSASGGSYAAASNHPIFGANNQILNNSGAATPIYGPNGQSISSSGSNNNFGAVKSPPMAKVAGNGPSAGNLPPRGQRNLNHILRQAGQTGNQAAKRGAQVGAIASFAAPPAAPFMAAVGGAVGKASAGFGSAAYNLAREIKTRQTNGQSFSAAVKEMTGSSNNIVAATKIGTALTLSPLGSTAAQFGSHGLGTAVHWGLGLNE